MADPVSAQLLEALPLVQRLALSYAPAAAREATLTLLALDNRLADIVRQRSEVLIVQLKLAWWRDRLGEPRGNWPSGEPLLERLRAWRIDAAPLVALVDGWEALLADDLGANAIREFANGRAAAWSTLAGEVGVRSEQARVEQAAREWALADLALHLDGDEAARASALARAEPWRRASLPRSLRPLAVLHGLADRALRRNADELLDGPRAAMLALRIGVTGR